MIEQEEEHIQQLIHPIRIFKALVLYSKNDQFKLASETEALIDDFNLIQKYITNVSRP